MNDNEKELEQQERQREKRANARRLAIAIHSAIDAGYAGVKFDKLKQLAEILFYQPEQLLIDIQDLDAYTLEKSYEDSAAEENETPL